MKLVAYLTFNGNCEEALNFYKNALDGEITHISKMGDTPGMEIPEHQKNNVMHATLKLGNNELMMSDSFDNAQYKPGNNITLSLHPETIQQEENLFSKMAEGGQITQPLQDTFWGARFGMLVDKFGINWMFNTELKK